MNYTHKIEKLEHSAVRLTVTVPAADIASEYNALVAKYAKELQLPGFRKGHVPLQILERKVGKALRMEASGDIMNKALTELFEKIDEKPLPYATPELDETTKPEQDFDLKKDFTFAVTYEIFPVVSSVTLDGITVKEPEIKLGKADLDEELKQIQDRNALVSDKNDGEAVAKNDIITINYCELADDGSEVANSQRQDYVFTVGSGQNFYKIDDEVVGMKKGETKEITKTYKKDFDDKDLAGTTKKIKLTVTAVKIKNLPALDDELAQDVNEKYKTLDDLKAAITKNQQMVKERRTLELKTTDLLKQLVAKNPIDIPETLILAESESHWQQMAQQYQMSVSDLENLYASMGQKKENITAGWKDAITEQVAGRIIIEQLIKDKNITVQPDDLEAEYAQLAEQMDVGVDEVKKRYAGIEAQHYLNDGCQRKKLFTALFSEVKVVKGDAIPFSEIFKEEE